MPNPSSWQKILSDGFKEASELLAFLKLPPHLSSEVAERQFTTRIPRRFAEKMEAGNPNDPLLLQVLASPEELSEVSGFTEDPVGEKRANLLPGLIHKYQGRVLVTLTGVCAINCRFCFRRQFPYQDNNPGSEGWQQIIDYITANSTIEEVIFSGGDPLLASDKTLALFFEGLNPISHVKTLRFHTRVPIVLPERVNTEFLKLLDCTRKNKVFVIHCNHSRELDSQVKPIFEALKARNCHLLNQSVLLKGINDQVATLKALSERLFSYGILPYYLHLLDKVKGAAHFDVSLEKAKALYKELQYVLPGYLLPRLVREDCGEGAKTLI